MISKVKHLASLTAAGAGALVLAGGTAEASIIDSGILNTVLTFTNISNPTSAYTATHTFLTTSHGPDFKIKLKSGSTSSGAFYRFALFSAWNRSTLFGENGALPFGATVNAAPGFGRGAEIGIRSWGTGTAAKPASYADEYYLFRFNPPPGAQQDYGWIELSLSITSDNSPLPADGPTVTIVQYAWDNTGATITAGEVAASASPEPSTLAESGLAALILGAAGLRRWRKARLAA